MVSLDLDDLSRLGYLSKDESNALRRRGVATLADIFADTRDTSDAFSSRTVRGRILKAIKDASQVEPRDNNADPEKASRPPDA